jgi:hypothetical protein
MNDELQRSATAPAATESFDEVVLPHLDAAYRLARWLMRNEHDAEDVVQDSLLRALRYFRTFTGGDGVPGSSELFATPVRDGAATESRRSPIHSMSSSTAASGPRPILRHCCCRPMTPR